MSDDHKLPPSNQAAERSVLGSVLRHNPAFVDVGLIVRAEDFYVFQHQLVFQSMGRLFDGCQPIDLVTLASDMQEHGDHNEVPYSLLAELWDVEPTGHNGTWYANLVKEASIRRSLIRAGTFILQAAQDGLGGTQELMSRAEQMIFAIACSREDSTQTDLASALNETCNRIDDLVSGKRTSSGYQTGFTDLDEMMGGLNPGELTIVAARPSVGKSAFAVSLLRNAAVDYGVPVFLSSLEMSRTEMAARLMCCEGRIDSKSLRKGVLRPDQWESLSNATATLRTKNIHIDDFPNQRMFRIAATARRLKMKHKIGIVIVDYLQLIQPEDGRTNRQEQVAQISRRLKLLARELEVAVVACAQLNRGSEDRKDMRPRLSDLRESGAIEQDSDNVLLLHRNEDLPGVIDVIVAKQRNGPTGTVNLTFHSQYMRFENHCTPMPNYFGSQPERPGA